jgi:glycosyltransferase involved in cell wall biosynthesis
MSDLRKEPDRSSSVEIAEEAAGSLRILHISNTDICADSRIRKELCALQSLDGADLHVIGVEDGEQSEDGLVDGARYRRLHLLSRRLSFVPRAIRYAFEMMEFTVKAVRVGSRLRPRVVHCHDTFALPAGSILKRLTGCRLIYDAHELESNKNGQNAALAWATMRIERACWSGIDLLISVSDSIIHWYVERLGKKPSLLVLNSPVVGGKGRPGIAAGDHDDYFRVTFRIPRDHLVFVYLGILGPGRGIETCLEAFEEGPRDAHLVLIGFGALKGEILRRAGRCGNIHFHDAVPHDQVVALVRHADYGLCLVENASLSDFFCLPNKLFEYCFAGLPVLASDFPEIKKLVEEYSLGTCCAPEPSAVRAALAALVGRPPARVSADLSPLSWEAQATRLRRAYVEQLSGPVALVGRSDVTYQP